MLLTDGEVRAIEFDTPYGLLSRRSQGAALNGHYLCRFISTELSGWIIEFKIKACADFKLRSPDCKRRDDCHDD